MRGGQLPLLLRHGGCALGPWAAQPSSLKQRVGHFVIARRGVTKSLFHTEQLKVPWAPWSPRAPCVLWALGALWLLRDRGCNGQHGRYGCCGRCECCIHREHPVSTTSPSKQAVCPQDPVRVGKARLSSKCASFTVWATLRRTAEPFGCSSTRTSSSPCRP